MPPRSDFACLRHLRTAARDERKTEADMGHPLKKGADRFEERAKSSDGKSAETKQKL